MGLLQQYDPPAWLPDLDAIAGQREAWHAYVSQLFANAISDEQAGSGDEQAGQCAFYDACIWEPGPVFERDIVWNAFPNELLRRFGRERAMREADGLWPLSSFPLNWRFDPDRPAPAGGPYPRNFSFRPGTEYCEWHVDRCAATGRMRRVTFSCEAPEYWRALFGVADPVTRVIFPDGRQHVLELYRTLVHPDVQLEDLLVKKPFKSPLGDLKRGDYNPYNPWNVERGIVHLTAPPNNLAAEIKLAAQATARFHDAKASVARRAEAIVAGANIGSANRHSDVAIAGAVNALVRQGRTLTLANPVGICIDHIDLAGWEVPGHRPEDCVRAVRGSGRCTTRLAIEVPSSKSSLEDVRIGGVPLRHGGQIAECITVRLRAAASTATQFQPLDKPLVTRGHVDPAGSAWVFQSRDDDFPPGTGPAFGHEPKPAGAGARQARAPAPADQILATRAMQ